MQREGTKNKATTLRRMFFFCSVLGFMAWSTKNSNSPIEREREKLSLHRFPYIISKICLPIQPSVYECESVWCSMSAAYAPAHSLYIAAVLARGEPGEASATMAGRAKENGRAPKESGCHYISLAFFKACHRGLARCLSLHSVVYFPPKYTSHCYHIIARAWLALILVCWRCHRAHSINTVYHHSSGSTPSFHSSAHHAH